MSRPDQFQINCPDCPLFDGCDLPEDKNEKTDMTGFIVRFTNDDRTVGSMAVGICHEKGEKVIIKPYAKPNEGGEVDDSSLRLGQYNSHPLTALETPLKDILHDPNFLVDNSNLVSETN